MKGVAGLPPIVIHGAFAALLILGILVGGTGAVNDFVKKQALDINADRISTTALSLNSADNASLDMQISDYEIRTRQGNVSLRFGGETAERRIEERTGHSELEGPGEWTRIDEDNICLKSTEEAFNISIGGC